MTARRAVGLAALLAACSGGPPAPFTVREDPSPPPPRPAPAGEPLRVAVLGDFGDDTRQQEAMARALAAAHARAPFDLALSPGDNLYECGPDTTAPGADACRFDAGGAAVDAAFRPPRDGSFERRFDGRWPALTSRAGAPVPVFLVLGNHDVATWGGCRQRGGPADGEARLKACLEVAHRSATWSMPARHYAVDRGPARFIAVDSNLLLGDYGGFTLREEVAFVRAAAAGCRERLCFVVAHHPAATAGGHHDELDGAFRSRLAQLVEATGGRAAAWLAGHDHDLQHLRAPGGLDVLVSGNGARGRPRERFGTVAPAGARLLFASTAWGLLRIDVWPDRWRARFETPDGAPLHCCEAVVRRGPDGLSPGRCEPAACAGFP